MSNKNFQNFSGVFSKITTFSCESQILLAVFALIFSVALQKFNHKNEKEEQDDDKCEIAKIRKPAQ